MTPEFIWELRKKLREIRTLLFEVPNTDECRSNYNQCVALLECLEREIERVTPKVQLPERVTKEKAE